MKNIMKTYYIIYPVVIFLVLILLVNTIGFVKAGNVGVVTRFGAVNRVVYPGMIIKIPFVESINSMNTQTQKDQVDANSASRDLQTVQSTIAVNYHLDGSHAVSVYQNIGIDYQDKVIAPAIQETFKSITSQYTAEELITKREILRQQAQDSITKKLSKYSILVDNFNIVNFDFSQDFNNAIEQKQVAQQNLEKAKIEAQTATTQATGQANAQAILKNSGSLTPEYIEFLAVQKWNGILPNATNGVPFINIPTK
jgi:regulator of protease activity HflC (stomatin/prohibitin superfamily)